MIILNSRLITCIGLLGWQIWSIGCPSTTLIQPEISVSQHQMDRMDLVKISMGSMKSSDYGGTLTFDLAPNNLNCAVQMASP